MSLTVTCPKCSHAFELPETLVQTLRENLRGELNKEWTEQEVKRRVAEAQAKWNTEEDNRNKQRDAEHQKQLRVKDVQIEGLRKPAAEIKRKAEQGSEQLQGDAQERNLEKLLRESFRFDTVYRVAKGEPGADFIQTVYNKLGRECGKITFESKDAQTFQKEWIEKLKSDQLAAKADVAVLVTTAMPKDITEFDMLQGVWICSFADVRPLVRVLRDLLMKVYAAAKSQEEKGDKIHMLYSYMVSVEFTQRWHAIREGISKIKESIHHERREMEKLWAKRAQQLEKVLINADQIRGSIDGIADIGVDLDLVGSPESQASASQASTSQASTPQESVSQAKRRKVANKKT